MELFRTVVMTTVLNNSKVLNFRIFKNFKILEHYVLNHSKPSFGRHPISSKLILILNPKKKELPSKRRRC